MMQYLEKIKSLPDGLSAAGAPLDDLDLIAYTLRGLPSEYDSFGTSIRVCAEPIDPDALHGLLSNAEIELQQREALAPPDSTSYLQAFHTSVSPKPNNYSYSYTSPNQNHSFSKPPLIPTQPSTTSH
ncbi:hypothetical protein Dsin_013188 [Dipteronia sinensis]|uniref:Uncharacterized protein n=1 Tax=Dipteronia sinensis TaxID=43782 RepID=A0AAE0E8N6_9ROSI|nr:hypothetical protein Dsin_013188 [Dipteronia sinensis]